MIKPNTRYEYTEPFRTQFLRALQTYENVQARKADGTYTPPKPINDYVAKKMAAQPPSKKQLDFLFSLGWRRDKNVMPNSSLEASQMIGEWKARKLPRKD